MKARINNIIDLFSKLFAAWLGHKVITQKQEIKELKRKIRVDDKINKIDNRRVNHSDVTKWLQRSSKEKQSL